MNNPSHVEYIVQIRKHIPYRGNWEMFTFNTPSCFRFLGHFQQGEWVVWQPLLLHPHYCHHGIFNLYFLCIFLTLWPLPSFISLFNIFAISLSFMLSIVFNVFPHCYPIQLMTSWQNNELLWLSMAIPFYC